MSVSLKWLKMAICLLAMVPVLALMGCGDATTDPTASRSDSQSEALRTRLSATQSDR